MPAKEDLLRAIKMGADSSEVWNMLGRCEKEFGEPERVGRQVLSVSLAL